MKISVIVPAYNEEKLLAASLAEIQRAATTFTTRGWDFELVVCDNNSTDRTGDIARAAGAKVIFEPFNQIGRARNTGASAATGDWFIFVDADSHPSPGLFADVADQIASGRTMAGGSTVALDEPMFAANLVTQGWNLTSRFRKLLAGSFIYIEASAFRELGGFDQEIFAGEELELSRRIRTIAQARGKNVVILHRHPLKTSARKMKLYTAREMWGVVFRNLLLKRQTTIRSREAAYIWYDGRR